jgi:hypothetical protein
MVLVNSPHGMSTWHFLCLVINNGKVEEKLVIVVQTFAHGIFK